MKSCLSSPTLPAALNPVISGVTKYNESDQLTLVCSLANTPAVISMVWLKHGESITSPRASITSVEDQDHLSLIMELTDLIPSDSGEYSCKVVSSGLGVKLATVNVSVKSE